METGTAVREAEAPDEESVPRHPAFLATLALGGAGLLAVGLWWPAVEGALGSLEAALTGLLPVDLVGRAPWVLLPALGLAGGLLASVSPCVLPLLPLNAAYIGATNVPPARAAAVSARFTLGAVVALSVLGLFADLAGAVFVEHRGPIRLAVGAILVVLGLVAAEIVRLPAVPAIGGSRRLGAVAAGAAFALITTPCASPILFAVLAASGAQGVPGLAVVTMAAFAVGYTALVFAAGVSGGRLVGHVRGRARAVQAGAAAFLLVAGAGFLGSGVAWWR